jgi:predicted DNA-binding protein
MQNYDKYLSARVTPEELKAITAQARAMDRTRSDYLRGIIKALQDRHDLRHEIQKTIEVSK